MGFTHRSRIHKQIISRRRTQFPTKKTEAENDIGTSGDTGDNKTRKEISARQLLGGDTQGSLDKAK